ncbi:MAG: hypothetical protein JWQ71_3739 [Pedosphaera sp.]|nr:hypothetical protein [Pedosphaera sp.]
MRVSPSNKSFRTYTIPSNFDCLTKDQLALLSNWLVEDGISYNAARERVLKEFGIKASPSSIRRFYIRTCAAIVAEREQLASGYSIEVILRQGGVVLVTKTVEVPKP